jgi:hypothetical protein
VRSTFSVFAAGARARVRLSASSEKSAATTVRPSSVRKCASCPAPQPRSRTGEPGLAFRTCRQRSSQESSPASFDPEKMRSHALLVSTGGPPLLETPILRSEKFALPLADVVAFYGVVGDVDLRRDALGADALLGV